MNPTGTDRRDRSARGKLRRLVYEMVGREPRSPGHHLWRDLMPLLALLLAFYAVLGSENKADRAELKATAAQQAAASQREGRQIAIAVLCGFGNGVEAAGKASIAQPILPGRFRRNLEKLGLPPERLRAERARKAGEAYARSISESVAEQASVKAEKVIQPDGSMDCNALQDVARATP